MPALHYHNRKTKNRIRIVKRDKGMLLVEYFPSGMRCWYKQEDFDRIFIKTV